MAKDNKSDSMNLDEFLEDQGAGLVLATIEPIPGRPEHVKLTPWRNGLGCLCQYAMEIPKAAIKSVRPTGDVHDCCGKLLRVVEVTFNIDAALSVGDVVGQLMKNMGGGHEEAHSAHPFEAGAPTEWASAVPDEGMMYESATADSPFPTRRPCPIGQQLCRGSCGERCYNPANSNCYGGLVCRWGWRRCGQLCQCYNPASQHCYGDIVCRWGWQRCHGRCGTRCFNPANSHCYGGLVCPWGWRACGCRCFNPATETCQRGTVTSLAAIQDQGDETGWGDAPENWI